MSDYDSWLNALRADTMRLANEGGATCPCCDQRVKVYRRKLNKTMARELLALARAAQSPKIPVNAQAVMRYSGEPSGDYAKLRFWGVLQQHPHGQWSITRKGWLWLFGDIQLPCNAVIYNNACRGLDGKTITFAEAHKSPFTLEGLLWDSDPI